jgi:hypothetical protein
VVAVEHQNSYAVCAFSTMQDILEKQKGVLGNYCYTMLSFKCTLLCAHQAMLNLCCFFPDTIMNIYIKTMTEDDDKEVVAQACMSVADIVKDCGFAAVELCKLHFLRVRCSWNTRFIC